mmetsp:Transcript_124863/g.249336  ORF Transcript_124863/g.249336 Transcript_124863/m.249336 type:complete len:279 (+) Transcript_124863:170-1006(+)|eukprot:CAMPEP_0172757170 /NCGR_PEP_ID=MMETSP1074-20121228/163225_1 /TAXON_ID=2916 /ORGANISM="Ceratium fusus, Strain PA161109" /LENGTH=278 /DNA_ID=CAMNT_0013590547 /DNA_START=79 /DNA_END=915 /DNA_ORIENTATION=-
MPSHLRSPSAITVPPPPQPLQRRLRRPRRARKPLKTVRHIISSDYRPLQARDSADGSEEVVRYPAGDNLDDFLLQISLSILSEGHLGERVGMDWTIGVLDGGVHLSFQEDATPSSVDLFSLDGAGDFFTLSEHSRVFCQPFPSEAGGKVRGFHVLTDRAHASHRACTLHVEPGQPGLEAFPAQEPLEDVPKARSLLVLYGLKGSSKAYFPRLLQVGSRLCLCADCLGEGGAEGFKLRQGEALVMEPGNGIAVTADGGPASVAAVQIHLGPGQGSPSKL